MIGKMTVRLEIEFNEDSNLEATSEEPVFPNLWKLTNFLISEDGLNKILGQTPRIQWEADPRFVLGIYDPLFEAPQEPLYDMNGSYFHHIPTAEEEAALEAENNKNLQDALTADWEEDLRGRAEFASDPEMYLPKNVEPMTFPDETESFETLTKMVVITYDRSTTDHQYYRNVNVTVFSGTEFETIEPCEDGLGNDQTIWPIVDNDQNGIDVIHRGW